MGIEILKLNLLSPVFFPREENTDPFNFRGAAEEDEEKLFCFNLNSDECLAIEPDAEKLLAGTVSAAVLPGGNYLFAQKREILSREEILSMAVEIQQEGLWQRLIPGNKLYLRYLFEDGSWVTQLFRPF